MTTLKKMIAEIIFAIVVVSSACAILKECSSRIQKREDVEVSQKDALYTNYLLGRYDMTLERISLFVNLDTRYERDIAVKYEMLNEMRSVVKACPGNRSIQKDISVQMGRLVLYNELIRHGKLTENSRKLYADSYATVVDDMADWCAYDKLQNVVI